MAHFETFFLIYNIYILRDFTPLVNSRDIVGRNWMLVTFKGLRVKASYFRAGEEMLMFFVRKGRRSSKS